MTPLKSQILGLLLGLSTAVGCIFYEKLVNHFSILGLGIIKLMEVIFFVVVIFLIVPTNELNKDYQILTANPKLYVTIILFILAGITSILWYVITKNQGVMVGSIYEVKYIVMLALIYIMFGENKFTWNTAIGVCFAIGSIYFISKT